MQTRGKTKGPGWLIPWFKSVHNIQHAHHYDYATLNTYISSFKGSLENNVGLPLSSVDLESLQ